ncbi:MAG: complex I NDUFA9 subunit family protein [Xanthobacteraceae bacterium]|nr:complex I NDUFA9 subunit family protein [Xanthobacteraceae bacterium]
MHGAQLNDRIVTVFGGTGFLGRHVTRSLRASDFTVRVASRHVNKPTQGDRKIQPIRADIRDPIAVEAALVNAWGVVNAVSLYVEHGSDTFHTIHVNAARTIAQAAREAGAERLVQVSGIGADIASPSLYVRKRAEGEQAVRAAFPGAMIARPAVMFGPDGGFVTTVLDLMRKLPVYPLFGRGQMRLQPVSVDDVADAIARILTRPEREPTLYEFGGPDVFTYEDFLRTVAHEAGLRPLFVPFPFAGWHLLARVAEILPRPPVTRNQVELMEVDTVASPSLPGLRELGITPKPVKDTVRDLAPVGG